MTTPFLQSFKTRTVILVTILALTGLLSPRTGACDGPALEVRNHGGTYTVGLVGGEPFHSTPGPVINQSLVAIPGAEVLVATWQEPGRDGELVPWYAISSDGSFLVVRPTSYDLSLRYASFDPLSQAPTIVSALTARADSRLFIVQFVTQPLAEYRAAIVELEGRILHFLAHHAYIVEMSAEAKARVEALPFVRWVGPYHPAYKLEEVLLADLETGASSGQPYHIQVSDGSYAQKTVVAGRIAELGGILDSLFEGGSLLAATLTGEQLLAIVCMDEVFFVDRRLPQRLYMNNVRSDGGADYVESVGGFTGEGVRGEVMDGGLLTTHQAWQYPPLIHGGGPLDVDFHGTLVYGICFGDGTGNASGRGLLPDAQGIFAVQSFGNRYGHISELVSDPYFAVFQTNSWGYCCTTSYGTQSMEIDEIIFDTDIIVLQAQANEGTRLSDVSAWAKNNVSVGGINHLDTLTRTDDYWGYSGSTGPAEDGRIKPDLAYWYDWILTPGNDGGYYPYMGGTSAATPITAGHFGLMFEMWSAGVFGNPVDPDGSVFDNRPHAATAKALMINSARPYAFSGPTDDLTRVHQGWGLANVQNLYDLRDQMFIINETDVLSNLGSTTHQLRVTAGTPAFKATMVYLDPPGTTASIQHRINDLTLIVTSPSGTIYYGNNGLLDGNLSVPGGSANTLDTVENVCIVDPEAGLWDVEVRADEINQDSHMETHAIDADYALVVTGVDVATLFSDGFESGDTTNWSVAQP